MLDLAAPIDAGFAVFGVPADYHPYGGAPYPVIVMPGKPEDVALGFGSVSHTVRVSLFDVRSSQVAQPAAGDVVVVGGRQHVVRAWRTSDPHRMVWRLECDGG